MKLLVIALAIFGFTVSANAEMNCKAKKGKFTMALECPDGRNGFVDRALPTDDIITVTYVVVLKNLPPKKIVIPGSDLKDLIKLQYQPLTNYPHWDKLIPYLNKKWKTKLQGKDISQAYPEQALVSPSIKIYGGLVEKGKTYIPRKPRGTGSYEVDATPLKATVKVSTPKGLPVGQKGAQ